jgi:hypothetical protein
VLVQTVQISFASSLPQIICSLGLNGYLGCTGLILGVLCCTGDNGNIEASFSFRDDGSEASLNFETGGDDISSGASLSFGISVWLNGDIRWFCGIVGSSKTISRWFHSMN